jgi:hypothetical protein
LLNYTSTRSSLGLCHEDNSTNVPRFSSSIDTIRSGNDVDHYQDANYCYWVADPANASQVLFKFTKFDLALGDRIEVYGSDSYPLNISAIQIFAVSGYHRFSTDNPPILGQIYTVAKKSALFRFQTDNNLNRTGFEIVTGGSLDVENVSLGLNDLAIYPNPTKDKLTVDFYMRNAQKVQITLCDIIGRKLYVKNLQLNEGAHHTIIHIGEMAKGIYMLQFITPQGVVTRKIVKE